MDVSRAQLSSLGDQVTLDDPGFPYTVRVQLDPGSDHPQVHALTVTAREGAAVTREALSRIPVRHLAGVAASELRGGGDEAKYRMLAVPRAAGERSWPPEHYQRVLRVAWWAKRSGRSGGEISAIAEFWDVCPRTVRRWLVLARGGR